MGMLLNYWPLFHHSFVSQVFTELCNSQHILQRLHLDFLLCFLKAYFLREPTWFFNFYYLL